MATIMINGCTLHYEELGSGEPMVLTPGGRWGREYIRLLAERMAARYRVIIYDRRNCGASDIIIAGDKTEAETWADDLAQLIRQLGVSPVYVGEYAGCRTSMMLAVNHPEVVKAITFGWPSGTPYATERLGTGIYGQWQQTAEEGGMQAVAETSYFAARIAENSGNRDRLLAMDPTEFARVVGRWREMFLDTKDNTIAGCVATDQQIASIQVPVMVLSGADPVHPPETAQRIHRLIPGSELHEPVITLEEWDKVFSGPYADTAKVQASRAAPVFLDFLERLEAA